MDPSKNVIDHNINRFNLLTSLLAILNKNDVKDTEFIIAEYIITHMREMAHISIYKVAEDCYLSRSSVQRFVKDIGYESYTQMKQNIAEVIEHEEALLNYTDHTGYADHLLESLREMNDDIVKTAKGPKFLLLMDHFISARSVVLLTAEDSAHACRLLQQQILATGRLIRIVSSASKNLSLLESLGEKDLLEENRDELESIGLTADSFGEKDVAIRTVPVVLGEAETAGFVKDILTDLEAGRGLTFEKKRAELLQTACKHAIKGGEELTEDQIRSLVTEMIEKKVTPTCPHGRPLVVAITRRDLDKKFKRIQ